MLWDPAKGLGIALSTLFFTAKTERHYKYCLKQTTIKIAAELDQALPEQSPTKEYLRIRIFSALWEQMFGEPSPVDAQLSGLSHFGPRWDGFDELINSLKGAPALIQVDLKKVLKDLDDFLKEESSTHGPESPAVAPTPGTSTIESPVVSTTADQSTLSIAITVRLEGSARINRIEVNTKVMDNQRH
ncbi:hypothetical protein SCARD494_11078 [Seiridium cardinale]